MKNFAEELAYWYFRVNGFFVLDNFVLHSRDLDSSQNADIDLLAIRQKHTYETIGGIETDMDPELFQHFVRDKHIGIICEVKSSPNPTSRSIKLNNSDRLTYAVRRIGFFEFENARRKASVLTSQRVVQGEYHQIGKVLIANQDLCS